MSIRDKAGELGFEHVGVARVGELPKGGFLRDWLAAGRHGEMGYLRKVEARLDPARVLRGARSVVCVLAGYRTDAVHGAGPLVGKISRHAWGDDYHEVLSLRLEELSAHIRESTGADTKVCVDSGPVLEKQWARMAGLGWQGKHTVLLRRDLASWFFLGEVLVAADLEPDDPCEEDLCGDCTRCIEACPTGAIVEPYVLDARRCISYLTIEHPGTIPEELRSGMGAWIYGCDACLEACPWSRDAAVTTEARFRPREGGEAPLLDGILRLDGEAFRRRFRGSAILRAGRRRFLRNAAVALGNCGRAEAREPLAAGLEDPEPLVRGHAAWGLGRIGDARARAALERRRAVERDDGVRREIDGALFRSPGNNGPVNLV